MPQQPTAPVFAHPAPPHAFTTPEELKDMVVKAPEAFYGWCAQLCEQISTLTVSQGGLSRELEQHQTLLGEIERKLEISEAIVTELRKRSSHSSGGEERLQISDFDGTRESYPAFKSLLKMKHLSERHRFPTEASFIAYVVSKLGPKAYKQVAPWVKDGRISFIGVDEMFRTLDQAYEDPQRQENAIRELQTLRQKNRPFVEFMADFRRLQSEVDFNESSLMATLKTSISRELLTALIYVPTPKTLDELIDTLSNLDSKMRSLSGDSRPQRTVSYPGTYTPATNLRSDAPRNSTTHVTLSNTAADTNPMDLSIARGVPRGPLTPAERQHRITNRLCLYCGKPGHISINCPNRKGPARVASLNLEPASEERAADPPAKN